MPSKTESQLRAVSAIDGRYGDQVSELSNYFSEFALIARRVKVEALYLLFLSQRGIIPQASAADQEFLLSVAEEISLEAASEIKELEKTTKHDVKAVELWLRHALVDRNSRLAPFVHIAFTSEDVNSLSYALILNEARDHVLVPMLQKLLKQLAVMAEETAAIPLLALTHGQPASPTTIGKEFANFAARILSELRTLETIVVKGKLTGAVGNYNAHYTMMPDEEWPAMGDEFAGSMGVELAPYTTQIVPGESYAHFFSSLLIINTALLDLDKDMWSYIQGEVFHLKKEAGQVGSSTMPHKVNPIDFENSEGNLEIANALFELYQRKFGISRRQRDLSDSTVKRTFGESIGHSLIAYKTTLRGLKKLSVNETTTQRDLDNHWEVLAEAYQVALKLYGDNQGYEKLQALTQDRKVTQGDLVAFVDTTNLPEDVKTRLKSLTPASYIGIAEKLTREVVAEINTYLGETHD